MSTEVRTCFFQNKKAIQKEDILVSSFSITFNLYYEVDYLPYRHHMNLKSITKPPFSLHQNLILDEAKVDRTISTLLSHTLVPKAHIESIAKTVSTKAKSIACDPRNNGFNVIPVVMSLRVIWVQEYNHEAVMAWERMLPGDTVMSFNLPATVKSVRELDKVVYGDYGYCLFDSAEQCTVCLKEFEAGEEITRMPCFHVYHGDCIVKWLKNRHLCPSCRFPMPVCRVVDGTFPFLKRKRCAEAEPEVPLQLGGGRRRKGARISVRNWKFIN